MGNLDLQSIVSVGSLLVAALALFGTRVKDTKADAMRHQLVDDKLDRSYEVARETRDAVRDMSKKLDDHAVRLTKAEERIDTLFRRVGRIEQNIDVRFNPESTD